MSTVGFDIPIPSSRTVQRESGKLGSRSGGGIILLFWTSVATLLAVGGGALAHYVYPVGALAAAMLLLRRDTSSYFSFVWMLWFVTPFVRRVVDYHTVWHPASPVVLAAPLAVLASGLPLLLTPLDWRRSEIRPFLLVFAGISYGLIVGLILNGLTSPLYDALEWGVPPLFALAMLVLDDGESARRLVATSVWLVIIAGVYGLLQFVAPLPWDRYWMQNVPMDSIGVPEPYAVRVFSTMNAPVPFAVVLCVFLLLLPASQGPWKTAAAVAGLAALMLSGVRAAWGGFVVGFMSHLLLHPPSRRLRLVGLFLLPCGLALVAFAMTPAAERVLPRLATIGRLSNDESFMERVAFHARVAPVALSDPVGAGLGSTGTATKLSSAGTTDSAPYLDFDSGLLNLPFSLGWPGTLLYFAGFLSILCRPARRDLIGICATGAAFATLAQLPFGNTLIGVSGVAFWTALALRLTGATPSPSPTSTD